MLRFIGDLKENSSPSCRFLLKLFKKSHFLNKKLNDLASLRCIARDEERVDSSLDVTIQIVIRDPRLGRFDHTIKALLLLRRQLRLLLRPQFKIKRSPLLLNRLDISQLLQMRLLLPRAHRTTEHKLETVQTLLRNIVQEESLLSPLAPLDFRLHPLLAVLQLILRSLRLLRLELVRKLLAELVHLLPVRVPTRDELGLAPLRPARLRRQRTRRRSVNAVRGRGRDRPQHFRSVHSVVLPTRTD